MISKKLLIPILLVPLLSTIIYFGTSTVHAAENCPNFLQLLNASGDAYQSDLPISKGSTGYKLEAVVSQCSAPGFPDGFRYAVRLTQELIPHNSQGQPIDQRKNSILYTCIGTACSQSENGVRTNSSRDRTITAGLNFGQTGSYSFYLDYKFIDRPADLDPNDDGDWRAINKIENIVVATDVNQGVGNANGNTNTAGSNANGNSSPPDPNSGRVLCDGPNNTKVPCTTNANLGEYDKPVDCAGKPCELINPIVHDSLISLLLNWIKLFSLVVVFFAIGMIMYGGFRMITSSGSETALQTGKRAVLWAILGIVAALLAFSIVSIIQGLVGAV